MLRKFPALVVLFVAASFAASAFSARADEGDDRKGGIIPLIHTLVPEEGKTLRERAKNAGVIEGKVLSVDRARGKMSVQSARGLFDIIILPSTSIRSRTEEFHTIADIQRDQRVRVFLSERSGVYFAQIIHLLNAGR